jgi:hypothetical protein
MAQAITFRAFGADNGVFIQPLPRGGTDLITLYQSQFKLATLHQYGNI